MTERTVTNVPLRTCHWCEDIHPEHIHATMGAERLYFCTDACWQEWAEQAGEGWWPR